MTKRFIISIKGSKMYRVEGGYVCDWRATVKTPDGRIFTAVSTNAHKARAAAIELARAATA